MKKSLKIAMIEPVYIPTPPLLYGGIERIAWNRAIEMSNLGHKITLIASKGSGKPPKGNLIETVDARMNFGDEQVAYEIYKNKLDDFDVVIDDSITGDSIIFIRRNGFWKRYIIKDYYGEGVKHGDMVVTLNDNLEFVFKPVLAVMNHGKRKIFRVKLKGGHEIKATGDHAFFVFENGLKIVGCSDLKGKKVVVPIGFPDNGEIIDFPSPIFIDAMPDELLTFFGLWLADGCYDKNTVNISYGKDKDILNLIKYITKEFKSNFGFSNDNQDIRIYSTSLKNAMINYGFKGTSKSKRVPEWCFNFTHRQIGLFLKGLFSGDGGLEDKNITFASISKKLIDDVSALLFRIGIYHQVVTRNHSSSGFQSKYSKSYKIVIGVQFAKKFKDLISFIQQYKNEKIPEIKKKGYLKIINHAVLMEVKSVELLPKEEDVFDLSIEDEERFIANNILVHNSHMKYSYLRKNENRELQVMGVLHTHPTYSTSPRYEDSSFMKANMVAVSNDHAMRYSGRFGVPILTAYNGIDLNRYPLQKDKGERFLWVGRFEPFKGAHLAVYICKNLGLGLDLVGKHSDTPQDYFSQVMGEVSSDPNINYLGEVDERTLIKLYQNAKAVIFPCLWEEPLGLVQLESQSCGTPIISTMKGAVPETVQHGKTGFLGSGVEELAGYLGRVDEIDPRDCREWIKRRFSKEVMGKRYEALCRRIVLGDIW